MGNYLNQDGKKFYEITHSDIYVDKTELLTYTNSVLQTLQKYICISRPRRFGKSITASMIAAYYSRGCDAKELFSPYKIARNLDFDTYRNKYNTLFLNMQEFLSRTKNIYELLDRMKRLVLRDLKREYPNVDYFDDTDLIESMQDVYQETNCPFVVIIDEWDCIFREYKQDKEAQEIYLDFLPRGSYIDAGIWELTLNPRRITAGSYDLWLPGESVIGSGTGFLYPTETTTLTIPSTAAKVISVGAYNAAFNSYAAFSGRGFTRMEHRIKPDLAAPGVNIISAAPGGGYTSKSGTSMAAPFVTGSCALLMEWGIVRGNDPYLYSEKVKAYLIRGTKKLPAFTEYPNPYIGWGTLCTADSIPT